MENKKSMSPSSRRNSFIYAFSGLLQLFRQEPNARLHALATLGVIAAGIIRGLSNTRWTIVILAIALVWITEAINTCVEKLCDFSCGNIFHPQIKVIKDISAGAVLIAAAASLAAGIIVFFF